MAFAAYKADLATGLANLVTFYNPSLIVLGGGLSQTDELYAGLEDAVDGATLPATRGKCKIVRSALGGDCAAMGAAWLAFADGAPTTCASLCSAGIVTRNFLARLRSCGDPSLRVGDLCG